MAEITSFKIHPVIDIARHGNSRNEFFNDKKEYSGCGTFIRLCISIKKSSARKFTLLWEFSTPQQVKT